MPVLIKISAAMARQKFNGCQPVYVRDVCHGACCRISTGGTLISILDVEVAGLQARGAVVHDNLLKDDGGRCPFQQEEGLCGLHGEPDKPFGCVASPWTLNKSGTLIIRNRYRMLVCYNSGRRQPAYIAFRDGLDLILGTATSTTVCAHLAEGGGDLRVAVGLTAYSALVANDEVKQRHVSH